MLCLPAGDVMLKNPPVNVGDMRDAGSIPGLEPTPGILPEKSHGQRSLAGCSPWASKEWDTTKHRAMMPVKSTLPFQNSTAISFKNVQLLWLTK